MTAITDGLGFTHHAIIERYHWKSRGEWHLGRRRVYELWILAEGEVFLLIFPVYKGTWDRGKSLASIDYDVFGKSYRWRDSSRALKRGKHLKSRE